MPFAPGGNDPMEITYVDVIEMLYEGLNPNF